MTFLEEMAEAEKKLRGIKAKPGEGNRYNMGRGSEKIAARVADTRKKSSRRKEKTNDES